jgi:hypothetical protein
MNRFLVWCLVAISSVLPIWMLLEWVAGVRLQIPDLVVSAGVVILPFLAMAILMLAAIGKIKLADLADSACRRRLAVVVVFGYVGAALVLLRRQHDRTNNRQESRA